MSCCAAGYRRRSGSGIGYSLPLKSVSHAEETSRYTMCSLDLSGRGLRSTEYNSNIDPRSVNYDHNCLTSLDHLHHYDNLEQLSAAHNLLTDMTGVTLLRNLTTLDLSNNKITAIKCLRNLTKLNWLNLSGNDIRVIENLNLNVNLHHLDLSDNSICSLGDIRSLAKLKVLLLHGNRIGSLATAKTLLPWSITTLSLASNNITDLNEVSHLSHLIKLEQLSIMNNPCVQMTDSALDCDYRPFIVNWCLKVRVIDGYEVTEKEALKAEWLYSQGKGRRFGPGEHYQLLQYLGSVCPLNASIEMEHAEDVKLSRVLQQQRLLQQQRRHEHANRSSASEHSTPSHQPNVSAVSSSDSSHHHSQQAWHSEPTPQTPASANRSSSSSRTAERRSSSGSEHGSLTQQQQQSVFIKSISSQAVRSGEASSVSASVVSQDLRVEDVSSDDESQTMLDSESRYLPVLSEPSSVTVSPVNRKSTGAASSTTSSKSAAVSDVKPVSRRVAANFGQNAQVPVHRVTPDSIQPMQSVTQPKPHAAVVRHKSQSPVSRTLNLESDSSVDASLKDTVEPLPAGRTSVELRLMKDPTKKPNRRSPGRRDENGIFHAASSSLYTPEKYQHTMRQIYGDDVTECSTSKRLSGSDFAGRVRTADNTKSREADVANGNQSVIEQENERTRAVTSIQALWRGYRTRHKDPQAVRVRREIRARRAEEHIRYLRNELDRQCQMNEQEKQLRAVHVEALKHLCKEVQSLQEWKNHVISSQEQFTSGGTTLRESCSSTATTSNLELTQQLIDVLEKASGDVEAISNCLPAPLRSVASPKLPLLGKLTPSAFQFTGTNLPCATQSRSETGVSQKELELENMCRCLEKQVSELRQLVTSTLSFTGNVVNASLDLTDSCATLSRTGVRQSCETESCFSQTSSWSFLPPRSIMIDDVSTSQAIIRWSQPTTNGVGVKAKNQLIAYRIYINNEPQGLVGGSQSHAIVNDLLPDREYRVHMRAVYTLGESPDSAEIEFRTIALRNACLSGQKDVHITATTSDDSDKELNSAEDDDTDAGKTHGKKSSCKSGCPQYISSVANVTQDLFSHHTNVSHLATAPSCVIESSLAGADIGASRTFPTYKLSEGSNDVRPVNTYPLTARKSLDQVLKSGSRFPKDAGDFVSSKPSTDSHVAEKVEVPQANDSQLTSEEEFKFLPKPPDESVFPRRNSLTRRGSMRRRNDSGSTQPTELKPSDESDGDHQSTSTSHPLVPRVKSDPSNVGKDEVKSSPTTAQTESESKSSPEESRTRCRSRDVKAVGGQKSERRSSSMGAVTRRGSDNQVKAAIFDKPPVGRRDSSNERVVMAKHVEDAAVAASKSSGGKAEKRPSGDKSKDISPSSKTPPAVIDKSSKDEHRSGVHKMKKLFAHRRSKSDLRPDVNTLPDRPQSLADEPTFQPTVPTPSSSPRLQRSSSFSARGDGSENSPLRQAISLETLKAWNRTRADPTGRSVPDKTQPAHQEPLATHELSANELNVESCPASSASPSISSAAATHSPRLTPKRSEGSSSQQLGNKAATLFAQLQKRISANSKM